MVEPELVVRLAIEHDRLNVLIGRRLPLSLHHQTATRAHIDADAIKQRRSKNIIAAGGIDSIEAERTDDIPGRHLAAIFIAREPVRVSRVLLL